MRLDWIFKPFSAPPRIFLHGARPKGYFGGTGLEGAEAPDGSLFLSAMRFIEEDMSEVWHEASAELGTSRLPLSSSSSGAWMGMAICQYSWTDDAIAATLLTCRGQAYEPYAKYNNTWRVTHSR
ncbi:hypothetical protein BDR05DRAFT_431247 [Suillus weaverae]|nr:hypothetical protein BDR05DRAFT_431247 [Suillus weaverae]